MTQLSFSHLGTTPESGNRAIRRPIHYLGSKLRIVDEIAERVNHLNKRGGPACDLFAGSGSVAVALAERGPVVSVDIQEYSRVICSALLHPNSPSEPDVAIVLRGDGENGHRESLLSAMRPLVELEDECIQLAAAGDPEPLCQLLEHGSVIAAQQSAVAKAPGRVRTALKECLRRLKDSGYLAGPDSLMSRYYGGLYFGYRQAADLDALIARIARTNKTCRDLFTAAALSTASDLVNTVGKQFAQPIRPRHKNGRPKSRLWIRVHEDRAQDVFATYKDWLTRYSALPQSKGPNTALRFDYREFLQTWAGEIGVFYADPPYTRDHYSRYYHVLETMCLRDSPKVSKSNLGGGQRLSRGVYRLERHQSPFCIKSEAPGAFESLFALSRRFSAPLVLSYSPYDSSTRARPRVMPVEDVQRLAKAHYSEVTVESARPLSHSKLNRSDLNVVTPGKAEIFVLCQP